MKTMVALLVVLCTVAFNAASAQQGGGRNFSPEQIKARETQRLKESGLKLTDAQVDSLVNINLELRGQMRGFRDMGDDERRTKMTEMNAYRTKRIKDALKDEELSKKVEEYYAQERTRMMNRGGNQ